MCRAIIRAIVCHTIFRCRRSIVISDKQVAFSSNRSVRVIKVPRMITFLLFLFLHFVCDLSFCFSVILFLPFLSFDNIAHMNHPGDPIWQWIRRRRGPRSRVLGHLYIPTLPRSGSLFLKSHYLHINIHICLHKSARPLHVRVIDNLLFCILERRNNELTNTLLIISDTHGRLHSSSACDEVLWLKYCNYDKIMLKHVQMKYLFSRC